MLDWICNSGEVNISIMIIRNQVMKTLEASSLNSRGSERPMVACQSKNLFC
ncbi:MAG: hypothetical protein IJ887_10345 [Prevotella sp.]|nr:hypothetical protein [Prevotella sp.]